MQIGTDVSKAEITIVNIFSEQFPIFCGVYFAYSKTLRIVCSVEGGVINTSINIDLIDFLMRYHPPASCN